MPREPKAMKLAREIHEQRLWIEKCGGSRTGYIANYGSKDAPDHHGDGGEAIHAADKAHLEALEEQLERALSGRRKAGS